VAPPILSRAAVIGAGSMGAGIAAQFANAGVPVDLLDLATPVGSRAATAIARQLKSGGFMREDRAALVRPGTVEDDLARVAEADWVIEAVVEDLDTKRSLYQALERVLTPGTAVSSNTSTIPLAALIAARSPDFARAFVITHFFNPPRQMPLVELVAGPATRPDILERVRLAADRVLGKTVLDCPDRPGFIANRIGCYWMSVAALEAIRLGLTVEEADAVAGAPFGVPRTGIFGLFDLVGIDLVPPVWGSLLGGLGPGDPHARYDLAGEPLFRTLVAEGRIGRKAGGGFYRQNADRQGPGRGRDSLDLATAAYRPALPGPDVATDLRQLAGGEDGMGRYAWRVLSRVVSYAAAVAPEIAGDVAAIDVGMRLGYAWEQGPFQLADRVGPGWIAERLAGEGETVPPLLATAAASGGFYRDGGREILASDRVYRPRRRSTDQITLADATRDRRPVLENGSAALWDIGDGVAALALGTKMNRLDLPALDLIGRAAAAAAAGFRALVIASDHARAFSVGADLTYFRDLVLQGDRSRLEGFLGAGQQAFAALRYASVPVVGAGFGLALGGGCELLLHCDAVVAHAELTAGLPEPKVGLVPGWGGTVRLLQRQAARADAPRGPLPPGQRAFETIGTGAVSASALQAEALGFLGGEDRIVMNRDHLLADARARAIALADAGYTPPAPALFTLPGPSGKAALMSQALGQRHLGKASDHDLAVLEQLATVLTGGSADPAVPVPEATLLRLEREALLDLAFRPATLQRIEHMLATGKPLRN
jgi:3-hydroxyacyl-CoA dehydrogenase